MMAGKTQISSSDDDGKEKQLMELPVDTLVYILLKLPAKSVGCIKCVSKTLLNMVNNTSFSTLHTRSMLTAPNSAAAADQVPRLMCCTRDFTSVSLHSLIYKDHTLTKGRYAVSVSSFPHRGFVRFVFCNVFCLGYGNGDSLLINPLGERGVLRLPENSFARLNRNCWMIGMGFDDKSNTYKIVCFSSDKVASFNSRRVHVLVLGTNSWRQISSLPPCMFSLANTELEPVCANGAVHWWLTSDHNIVSFDLRKEEFFCIPTPPTIQSSNRDSNLRMFTLRGCLAIVETKWSSRSMEIWVLKDFDEKRWVRYYYNNRLPDDFPIAGYPGEWEHGVFFTAAYTLNFIDIRTGSINRVVHDEHKVERNISLLGIYSYSDTLISLRDYGNLDEELMIEMMT